MKIFAPHYYPDFTCIASRCRHNCCIGWEIDIDGDTLEKYKALGGALGERLRDAIEEDENGAHFRLGAYERCPFLNGEGLCDIITAMGEEALCEICTQHPRYRHFLSDRTELGLGLCCEEAVRLLLSQKEKTRLVLVGEDDEEEYLPDPFEEKLLKTREVLITLAQDRSLSYPLRVKNVLSAVRLAPSAAAPSSWTGFYRSLERLDSAWDGCLDALAVAAPVPADYAETESEQLLVYFLLRHLAEAEDGEALAMRTAFAVHAVEIIRAVACALPALGLAETVRLYSSEIEYSEENTEAVMQKLFEEMQG